MEDLIKLVTNAVNGFEGKSLALLSNYSETSKAPVTKAQRGIKSSYSAGCVYEERTIAPHERQ